MSRLRNCPALLVTGFLLCLGAPASQDEKQVTNVAGNISDIYGVFIRRASVALIDAKSGARIETESDDEGLFQFHSPVGEGDYRVEVNLAGYQPFSRELWLDQLQIEVIYESEPVILPIRLRPT